MESQLYSTTISNINYFFKIEEGREYESLNEWEKFCIYMNFMLWVDKKEDKNKAYLLDLKKIKPQPIWFK